MLRTFGWLLIVVGTLVLLIGAVSAALVGPDDTVKIADGQVADAPLHE